MDCFERKRKSIEVILAGATILLSSVGVGYLVAQRQLPIPTMSFETRIEALEKMTQERELLRGTYLSDEWRQYTNACLHGEFYDGTTGRIVSFDQLPPVEQTHWSETATRCGWKKQ